MARNHPGADALSGFAAAQSRSSWGPRVIERLRQQRRRAASRHLGLCSRAAKRCCCPSGLCWSPHVHPATKAVISGFKAAIDAMDWLVAEVAHTIGDRGLATTLKLEAANSPSTH